MVRPAKKRYLTFIWTPTNDNELKEFLGNNFKAINDKEKRTCQIVNPNNIELTAFEGDLMIRDNTEADSVLVCPKANITEFKKMLGII